jgi:hypothetical protein
MGEVCKVPKVRAQKVSRRNLKGLAQVIKGWLESSRSIREGLKIGPNHQGSIFTKIYVTHSGNVITGAATTVQFVGSYNGKRYCFSTELDGAQRKQLAKFIARDARLSLSVKFDVLKTKAKPVVKKSGSGGSFGIGPIVIGGTYTAKTRVARSDKEKPGIPLPDEARKYINAMLGKIKRKLKKGFPYKFSVRVNKSGGMTSVRVGVGHGPVTKLTARDRKIMKLARKWLQKKLTNNRKFLRFFGQKDYEGSLSFRA